MLLQDDGLINEFRWKLRSRQKDKELSENGFVSYNYETSKERCEKEHERHQQLYSAVKGKFNDNIKLRLRSRERNNEIHQPMSYNAKTENSRLETMKRIPYDNEGFDLSYFSNYKFRDEASPDKIVDKNQRF